MKPCRSNAFGGVAIAAVLCAPLGQAARGASAADILQAASTTGGLVVHVGCGDGKLTAALAANDALLVHGLDRAAGHVAKARQYLRSRKLAGRATVELWTGAHLPYVSNTVNLVVAEDLGRIPPAEVMRVLRPGGVAIVDGQKAVKPRPDRIDEWTHYMHAADGNAVAEDTVVGPPRRIQWRAGPVFGRHHDKLASVSAMVSSGGRLFCILDEGPTSLLHFPPKWRLVARDAFNGKLLWKKTVTTWADHMRAFRSGPPQLPRRLVATGGRVYVTLGLRAPVTALDAATGKVVRTYAGTADTDEILVHNGFLLAVIAPPGRGQPDAAAERRGRPAGAGGRGVWALRADTGAVAWKKAGPDMTALHPMTLAAAGQRACYQVGQTVVCVDLKTGREIWRHGGKVAAKAPKPTAKGRRRPRPGRTAGGHYAPTLVMSERTGVVLSAHANKVTALSLDKGKALWTAPCPVDFRAPADLFVINGLVYPGLFSTKGRNARTGKVENVALDNINTLVTPGHHPRCHRNMATTNYIITDKHGMEFIDLAGKRHSRNVWVRGGCQFGMLPANGLVTMPPNACCCYQGAMLHGLYAFAPESKGEGPKLKETERLEKGPAYAAKMGTGTSAALRSQSPSSWPTFRSDAFRSGAARTEVPAGLKTLWQAKVGGKLRPPVIAAGKVLVPAENAGTVTCLDAADGRALWTFHAAGRIDSPPTIWRGRALFGSADGHVYCVRLADGKLAWRFRAAPRDLRVVVDDHLESVWPVPGSVLVLDGVAYFAAGRSTYLDGGIHLYALDADTGEKRHQTRYAVDHDKDGASTFAMAGTTCDVLTTDGTWIYLKDIKFDRKLVRRQDRGRHLYADSGLTDDQWFYRSFWKLGWGGLDEPIKLPWSYRKYNMTVPFGQLLVFDDKFAWGLQTKFPSGIKGYKPGFWGVKLFRTPNTPFDPGKASGSDVNNKANWPPPIKYAWQTDLPFQARAMVMDRRSVFVAGWPDVVRAKDPYAAVEGRAGGVLWVFSRDGKNLAEHALASSPVFDGMAAAGGRLYVAMKNGSVACLGAR